MANAIIVDDEHKSRANLEMLLKRYCPEIEVLGQSDNIMQGEELIRRLEPDIVFLDIEMQDGTGFELLEKFDHPSFVVIFITAHIDYAVRAIRFSALDYLMKPVDITELKNAVEKALKRLKQKEPDNQKALDALMYNFKTRNHPEILAVPTMEGLQFVAVKSIIRCSADANYTQFFLENNISFLVPRTLKEYEELLAEMNFFRVHQSHLVNLLHIRKYVRGEGGYLIMSDQSKVEVSRRKKNEFLDKLIL